jgi:hypothetical protein
MTLSTALCALRLTDYERQLIVLLLRWLHPEEIFREKGLRIRSAMCRQNFDT